MTPRDSLDLNILAVLQTDGRATMAEVGARIGLSASAVTRRLEKLEHDGVILSYAALLDHKSVGLKMTAFVTVTLIRQSEEMIESFEKAVVALPEVAEVHLMAGSADYLLRVLSPDLEAYEQFLKHKLTRLKGVAHVQTSFSLSSLKAMPSVPLSHLEAAGKQRPRGSS
jgi:Lrp/AsnC family transcriptional regulator, leucine-responsive regulatory protein